MAVPQWLPMLVEKSEKSEEPMDENFEMEIGITCGEEDGVDNSGVDAFELYSIPEEIYQVYTEMS